MCADRGYPIPRTDISGQRMLGWRLALEWVRDNLEIKGVMKVYVARIKLWLNNKGIIHMNTEEWARCLATIIHYSREGKL
jgi:hypothetical protein